MKTPYNFAFLLCLIIFSLTNVTAFSGAGEGSLANPFIITNCPQLQEMNNSLSSSYALGNDINCYADTHAGGTLYNGGLGFDPIGTYDTNYFSGSLNGRYHIIFDLYINRPNQNTVGLIEFASGAKISKIGLKKAYIIGEMVAGGIIGRCNYSKGCIVLNSFFNGTIDATAVISTYSYSGGIIGLNKLSAEASLIQNCITSGTISAKAYTGGITSYAYDINVINSFNLATVTSRMNAIYKGGLVGGGKLNITKAYIKNSFSKEQAIGWVEQPEYVGRSYIYCISSSTIDNCTKESNQKNLYSSTHTVYNASPSWSDGNWIWTGNYFPSLAGFAHCFGEIDSKAVLYDQDGFGLDSTDNNVNVLSNTNTSRTCEWYCDTNYYIGTGTEAGTCVPYYKYGSGTVSNPWIVNNCIDLQNMRIRLDGNYALGNDINCYNETHQGGVFWNDGKGFEPIGYNYTQPFFGNFDGRNNVIAGLFIDRTSDNTTANWYLSSAGLFGNTRCSLIKNLGVVDANIIAVSHAGLIAGYMNGYYYPTGGTCRSSLTNSFGRGVVNLIPSPFGNEAKSMGGGLAGAMNMSSLTNSYFDGNVKGPNGIGGITGLTSTESLIKNTFAKGLVIGTSAGGHTIGGIAGTMFTDSSLINSYNLANVSGNNGAGIGGLVGILGSNLSNSFSTGNISGYYTSGGKVIGELSYQYSTPSKSNLYCLSPGDTHCTGVTLASDFYSNTNPVYAAWNDGNWIWPGNDYPYLNFSPRCTGPIDADSNIIPGDDQGLTIDVARTLVNTDSPNKCEYKCRQYFYKGTASSSEKCFPYVCTGTIDTNAILYFEDNINLDANTARTLIEPNSNTSAKCQYYCKDGFEKNINTCTVKSNYYTCLGDIDSNAIPFIGDDTGVTIFDNFTIQLVDANTKTKCEYHCRDGFYKSGNVCLPNTCITPLTNATYYSDDNTGLIPESEKASTLSITNTSTKCQMFCNTDYHINGNVCVLNDSTPCTGSIDSNASIYFGDDLGFITPTQSQNILVDSNTARKCEYHCNNYFYKGTGLDTNKCLPYVCIGEIDSNAVLYPKDDIGLDANTARTLVDSNNATKCQYYCDTNYFYRVANTCATYTCTNPILHSSYYQDDNTGIIPKSQKESILSEANDSRKCQMKCDTNYHAQENTCVENIIITQPQCIGSIPNNSQIWDPEEEMGLEEYTPITLSSTDNPLIKCQYNCLPAFQIFDNNCVPATWEIGKCGIAKRFYYAGETFPIGEYCNGGTHYPDELILGDDIGNMVTWMCIGDINSSPCTAKRVDEGTPQMSSCAIFDLIAKQDNEGNMSLENYCSCSTPMDLTFINYETGEELAIEPNPIDCSENFTKYGLGFSESPITKDTLIQIKGNIKEYVEDCTTCEVVTYLSYQMKNEEPATIPDNSIILILAILCFVSFVLIQKKRI